MSMGEGGFYSKISSLAFTGGGIILTISYDVNIGRRTNIWMPIERFQTRYFNGKIDEVSNSGPAQLPLAEIAAHDRNSSHRSFATAIAFSRITGG
jgi:hypothetical protein